MKKIVKKGSFVVLNDRGLHTRPSTELVKCTTSFKSSVTLQYKNCRINAKSLLGILMLAAQKGAKIYVEAEGPDAKKAVKAIITLSKKKFLIKY